MDALRLISPDDECFHCESCNGELVAESDKLAAQEVGDADDNAKRRRHEKLKDVLQKMEVCYLLRLTSFLSGLLVNYSPPLFLYTYTQTQTPILNANYLHMGVSGEECDRSAN